MGAPSHGSSTASVRDFGRLKLLDELTPAVHSNAVLKTLAKAMIGGADAAKDGVDSEENCYIPAGYTYLGQFVDHDLTFDAHSNFDDPKSLEHAANQRTPRFDLDCIYGRGPEDQPYLYRSPFDGTLLLGEPMANGAPDVQRNADGRAVIGDPRNDENAIVVQLQSAFIRFHNAMVHRHVTAGMNAKDAFRAARSATRRHYQRIVLDDLLPRVLDLSLPSVAPIMAALSASRMPTLRLYDLRKAPYMPIEFSVAAYRFGHSLVRPGYRLSVASGDTPQTAPDFHRLFPIFDNVQGGLLGFRKLDPSRHIDWKLFFSATLAAGAKMDNAAGSANNAKGPSRTQLAYKLDTSLVDPLAMLPTPIADDIRSLAERNLVRGRDFGLPSGQDVARRIGASVLSDDLLSVRPDPEDFAKRTPIKTLHASLAGNAPLWFYILAEADQEIIKGIKAGKPPATLGSRLGEVGSAIVLETFVGLMLKDDDSVLNASTPWRSINGKPTFSMAELFAEIGTPI